VTTALPFGTTMNTSARARASTRNLRLVYSTATVTSLPSVRPNRPLALRAAPVASMCFAAFARPRNGMLL
jgi:hypothetical protein